MQDRSAGSARNAHPHQSNGESNPAPAPQPVERSFSERCADLENRINIELDPNRGVR